MPLDFARYHSSVCAQRIVESWRPKYAAEPDTFDKFYYLWSAFNAWALVVTLSDSDKDMINQISNNRDASSKYGIIINNNRILKNNIANLKPNFPLQSFADLIRIDYQYDWTQHQGSEDYYKKIVNSGKGVKSSPELDENSFHSVLHCMYAVRCNLFHGSKSACEGERLFVSVFSNLLLKLLDEDSGLLSLGAPPPQ